MALRRFRNAALWATLVFAMVSMTPRPALGCSCLAPVDLRAMLDDAPAAFVGVMVDRQRGGDEFEALFHFEVETWVKSDLGTAVDVHSGSNSAMCGFETPTGERIGLLVYNDGPKLTSSLCSMVSPDELIRVASEHNTPSGAVPPLIPEDIGLTRDGSSYDGSTTARVALGVITAAALAGLAVTRMRQRSAEEE